VKHIAVIALAAGSLIAGPTGSVKAQEVIGTSAVTGAGSTFAYPLISRWSKGYQQWIAGGSTIPIAGADLDDPPTRPVLDYEPSGSLGGTMRVRAGAVDFGASDMPLKSEELRRLGVVQFPIVIGGIVAVVNVDGIGPGDIQITGPVLADIFLGNPELVGSGHQAAQSESQIAGRQNRCCSPF
jgi:phosphate transport system substrate-binding protein